MPTPAAIVALNAQSAANLRLPATASVEDKDVFQALLDIGVDDADANSDRNSRLARDDDRREIIAAPVNADVNSPPPPAPVREEGDHDAHVRAYENDNNTRDRVAIERSDNERPAPARRAHSERDAAVQPTRQTETLSRPERNITTDDSERDALASDLRHRLAALNHILQLFASFGGDPQAVQVKVENVLLQVSTVTAVGVSADETDVNAAAGAINVIAAMRDINANALLGNIDANATIGNIEASAATGDIEVSDAISPDGTRPLETLLKNILARLEQLSTSLDETTADSATRTTSDFRALIRDVRQMTLMLNGNPEATTVVAEEKTPLEHATRTLMRHYTEMQRVLSDAPVRKTADALTPVDVDNVLAKTDAAEKILPKQTAPEQTVQTSNAVRAEPVSGSTPIATVSAANVAASGAHVDTRSGTGDQSRQDQSLPQAAGTIRAAGHTPANQTVATMNFAQLLQQAKTPVLEQVMVHIKTGLAENKSEIKISLQPEELGKLEIKIHVDANGKTVASIMADNRNTLDLLQRDARGLERALADAGLKTDSGSLSFNLRGGQQENTQTPAFAQSYRNPLPDDADTPLVPVVSRSYVINVTDGLDLTV